MTLKDDLDRAQFSAVVARDSLSHAEAEVERLRARVRTLEGALRYSLKMHADHEDRCLWCGKPWPCADYENARRALSGDAQGGEG